MERIAEYRILNNIDETNNSIVYRGQKEHEDDTVIIKVLKTEFPSLSEIARFKQEYALIKNLDLEGVVKTFDFIKHNDTFALIMEDFDGIPLQKILRSKKTNISFFLQIATRLANTLGFLHKKDIIHKDIKPQNILINSNDEKVKLADFGISSVLTRENEEIYNPLVIEGTLAYMSPEQTGRMNCDLDYRTDLYSLGITFYEMLTGSVPFQSKDPVEMIHSHIARQPQPPGQLNREVPEAISNIVMKLLSKTADERYQNSFGLLEDLEQCERQLKEKGSIDKFKLATKDVSLKFNIPNLLVGREKEIDILMKSFERVSNGASEILLVSGRPGVGKTALINEIQKPVAGKRGCFISGKYDRFRKDVPYSAISQAFQGLVSRILVESGENIKIWKEKILAAVGSNGKVITDIIPDALHIIGEQPNLPLLGPDESRNRFNLVLRNFINVFAAKEHPLVLFLDDLQWADSASLVLVQNLLNNCSCRYLLMIGTYRESEIDTCHPLINTLDDIRKTGIPINEIELAPLDTQDVIKLISRILNCEEKVALRLAELVRGKTNGNPFFINQFFKKLYDERMLELDSHDGWKWEMEVINKMQVTDNVVDLMADRISKLDKNTRDILMICSCIGSRFDLETLAIITESSIEENLFALASAIQEGLVCLEIKGYVSLQGNEYLFRHDRIQEAAYSLIPAAEKAKMHYTIGMKVLTTIDDDELPEKIFYIIDQLNKGIELVLEDSERIVLAGLNLHAGERAKNSSAYDSAVRYLKTGMEFLPESCWEDHYELAFSIYKERLECEYINRNFTCVEDLFAIIALKAKGNVDKAAVFTLMVTLLTTRGNYKEALRVGYKGMKMLGKSHPRPGSVSKLKVGMELLKLRYLFGKRKIEDLADLPAGTNDELNAYAALANHMGTAAYYTDTKLFALLSINAVSLIIKNGNSEYSPLAFNALATILGPGLGLYQQAYRFGRVALELIGRFASPAYRCKIEFVFCLFILHWKKHAKHCVELFKETYKHGMESGDIIFSGRSINQAYMTRIIIGDNIDEILEEYGKYEDFQKGGGDPLVARRYAETVQMCRCLKGETGTPGNLTYGDFDENEQLDFFRNEGILPGIFYFLLVKIRVLYLFGEYAEAMEYIPEMEQLIKQKVSLGNIQIPEFYFYYSLILSALCTTSGTIAGMSYKTQLRKNLAKMGTWARNCPENYLHKFLLMKAEMARIKGNTNAAYIYNQAIRSAWENGYTQNEGIANELAARFYLENRDRSIAAHHVVEARRCYLKWGATAKVKYLERMHSDLIIEERKQSSKKDPAIDTLSTSTGSARTASGDMDIAAIIKTSQAISEEIDLDKLLIKIMTLSIENAGAEKGFLVLPNGKDKQLYVEAAGQVDEDVVIFQSLPLEECDELSSVIVEYVKKTGENIVINDALLDDKFKDDPYVVKNKPRSILCAAITYKGKVSGIIYLENRLAANVFTPERLEILRIFFTQASISIENTRLLAQREKAAKLETKMKIAANIQSTLLPDNPEIDGFEITAYVNPAEDIGGDYYDIINCEDKDWVIIGDVSGHGVPSGLVMMMVQTSIQTILRKYPDTIPSELLSTVNEAIKYNVQRMNDDKYMTITAFSFNKDGSAVFSGLHQDIFIYRAASGCVEVIESDGIWLSPWELGHIPVDLELKLNPGDALLLYTDGITEAMDRENNEFSEQRLAGLLEKNAGRSTEEIKDVILDELTEYNTRDDVTMVILKKK
ncbi:MAG: AAA family ATPase [bacterium]|nr:AAA family ATPase [bacterium]